MGAMQRRKGARGELAVCRLIHDLLGIDARRRVRQHDGDSDVLGLDGWTIEVKNAGELRLREWWQQAVDQRTGDDRPAVFYKVPRRGWRVLWPIAALLRVPGADTWTGIEWTCDTTPEAWAAVARELAAELDAPSELSRFYPPVSEPGNGISV